MAVQHGMPGEWAKVRGTVRSLWPLGICLVCFGAFAAATVLGQRLEIFGALFAVSAIAVAFWWRRGLLRVESFFKGARGEEAMAGMLARLSDDWHIYHDFVAGKYHVDHVLVGPAGVFAVETKNWRDQVALESGELIAGGHVPDHPPIAQATAEAKAVGAVLARAGWTGEVFPVVCFASGTFKDGFAQSGKVLVANAEAFLKWLVAQPSVHAPGECARVVQLLETRDS
ncbi:MAG: NERD domain-containing protein [Kiritimatiellae bacterium]|nr:NERD domain-containing protein [Kiritimatiellia bacterium]